MGQSGSGDALASLAPGAAKLQAAALQALGQNSADARSDMPRGYQPERPRPLPPADALGPIVAERQPSSPSANLVQDNRERWSQPGPTQCQPGPTPAHCHPGPGPMEWQSGPEQSQYESGHMEWRMPRADSWEAPRLPLPDLQELGTAVPSSPSKGSSGVELGDMMEAFSGSASRWFVARVVAVAQGDDGDVVTVYFHTPNGPKQKSLYFHDHQLAPLGTNLNDSLPPGFIFVPSQSRPGQLAYFDPAHNLKFGNQDLAWESYFDRLLGPAPNAQASLQPAAPSAVSMPGRGLPPLPTADLGCAPPRPPPAMAEDASNLAPPHHLERLAPRPPPAEQAAIAPQGVFAPRPPPAVAMGWAEENARTEAPPRPSLPVQRDAAGRVALPSFGQQGGSSQASYLGSLGMSSAFAEVYKPDNRPPPPQPEMWAKPDNRPPPQPEMWAQLDNRPPPEPEMWAQESYMPQNYMPPSPHNCMPPSPPRNFHAKAADPQLESWRADPFSEWRR